jgi:AcrR family transcriptional regulator
MQAGRKPRQTRYKMPRPYSMEKRQAASSETRSRILEASRQLLASESETDLSMDAIARRADVSRLTIYYQFDSRTGLLEALYDYLAQRGNMRRMPEVFHEPDPRAAINRAVGIFVGFWASDPVAIRRLRGMAALDPEIGRGIQARDARRHQIFNQILKRLAAKERKEFTEEQFNSMSDVLAMLTGFAAYDALAGAGHSPEEIVGILSGLAHFSMG